jgi:hypothetical protein
MTASTKARYDDQIDSLMEEASRALSHSDYFVCERAAAQALQMAFQREDYERMARILLPLEEARRQKRLAAVDTGNLKVLNNVEQLDEPIEAGCYLLEPLLVAADGRNLRDQANEEETPVLVIVHEPVTRTGHWPLAMVGPVTVRTRVDPPEKVTIEWLLAASEALGEEAIEMVDPELETPALVSAIYDRLQTCVDHDGLHQTLMKACELAAREQAEQE